MKSILFVVRLVLYSIAVSIAGHKTKSTEIEVFVGIVLLFFWVPKESFKEWRQI